MWKELLIKTIYMFDFFPATLYDGSWNSRQSSGGVSGNISGVSGRAFAEYSK